MALASRTHEGVIWSNRDKRAPPDKMATLFINIVASADIAALLAVDAYLRSSEI